MLKAFTMNLSSRIGRAAIALGMGGVLIFKTATLAAETFTMDTARAAADKGDPQAEFFLARHYAHGLGVPRDYSRAIKYLRQAATQRYAPAQTGLGSCYANGQGVQQDYIQAVQWYCKAAVQNDPLAEYCLGEAYANGTGVPKEMKQALAWWQKAAAQGQVNAENALGRFYLYGEHIGDTNINAAEAARWFRKAAEQDYAPAMGVLGYMYLYNVGVDQDWTQALRWSRKAAELNEGLAQDNLGQMYENGEGGLPRDLVQAYKWFWLSQLQGNQFGEHDVFEIETHHALAPEKIAEAKRLAAEFRAQHSLSAPTSEDTTDSNELKK